jgi:hypothetical protein
MRGSTFMNGNSYGGTSEAAPGTSCHLTEWHSWEISINIPLAGGDNGLKKS